MTIEIEIDVYCSECGNILGDGFNRDSKEYTVTPCEFCLDDARKVAFDEGQADGYEAAEVNE